jgi:hypothetical protein
MGLGRRAGATDPALARGESKRVFNLPIEQLAGQIGAAADVALTARAEHPALISALAGEKAPEDSVAPPPSREDDAAYRLAQRVRAGVDQLQISVGERWRQYVQGGAIWISGLYGIGLTHAADHPVAAEPRYVLAALVLGGPSPGSPGTSPPSSSGRADSDQRDAERRLCSCRTEGDQDRL